jgi:hypothetical protein
MSDPMDLLCRARALRGVADQTRMVSRMLSSQDDQVRLAAHANLLDRDAERLEHEAVTLSERQRRPLVLS